jgi:hypothetical protein
MKKFIIAIDLLVMWIETLKLLFYTFWQKQLACLLGGNMIFSLFSTVKWLSCPLKKKILNLNLDAIFFFFTA